MLAKPLLNEICFNESLTRGLADPEARMLVEWIIERAEREDDSPAAMKALLRRGRAISRFVGLWCHARERGAACQLAASERFRWPLPTEWYVDPYELMHSILDAEDAEREASES